MPMIDKYKDLIIKEAYKDVENVTNEMLQSKLDKGGLYCPSKEKVVCFSCGCFTRLKAKDAVGIQCDSCDGKISL